MNILSLERNNIPLYFQLEQIIKSKIITGEFMPGEQIPTEKDLCEIYGVSSITSRQAILNLVQEGLLIRRQGKGTFVKEGLTDIKTIKTLQLSGDLSDMIPDGLKTQKVKVLDIIKIKTPKKVAKLLDIEEGKEVVRVRRTRSDNSISTSYTKNYFPLEIGERIKKEDLYLYPPLYILKEHLRIPISGGIQYIEAIVADYDIASALSVIISSPILYFETIIFDSRKKPVEFIQAFYRSDLFRFAVKLNLKRIKNKKSKDEFEVSKK